MLSAPDVRLRRISIVSVALLSVLLQVATQAGFAQQKLVTPQETNEKIRQLAVAARTQQGDLLIGSGDLLHIEVFDAPDLSRDVRVSDSGYVSLPLIPVKIHTAGLTAFQLEEKLAELLQVNGLMTQPQVTVFVKEHLSQPITVIGAVRKSMVYQAIRQTTLLEVLSQAEGIADDAGSVVMVTRPASSNASSQGSGEGQPAGAQTMTIGMKDLLESGDPKYNIPVFGGDIVSVPRAGIVYVVGAVEHPGGFVLQNDGEQMTALRAIALAQGLKGSARPGDAVIIRKNFDTGKKQEIEVNLKKIMTRKAEDVHLLANDVLFIPDSAGKKALRRAGEVALSITSGLVILRGGR